MTNNNSRKFDELSQRDFVKYSAGTVACVYLTTLNIGCSSDTTSPQVLQWPISNTVYTTAEQQVLPIPLSAGTPQLAPKELALYSQYNYSSWTRGTGLKKSCKLVRTIIS